jgi:type I restriction enzyme S subunit
MLEKPDNPTPAKNVPLGWRETTVEATGEYLNGVAFKPSDWASCGTPIIRIQNLTDPSKPFNYTKRVVDPAYTVRRGDILVSWSATLDAFRWGGEEALLNQHIFKVTPNRDLVTEEFLFYLLRHAISEMVRTEHLHGSTMQHINRGPFLGFPVTIPPKTVQRAIASKLDELFTDLNAGVAALERVRAKLKRYRAAVLKAAVEGRLTAEWRQTNPPAESAADLLKRILAERRQKWEADQLAKFAAAGKTPTKGWQSKYVEPKPPDTSGLLDLPEGWCWATVAQCAWEVTVGHVGPMRDEYLERGVPFLRSQNVRPLRFDPAGIRYISTAFDAKLVKSRLEGGELLVVRSGSIGDACVYPEGEPAANCSDLVITRLLSGVCPQYAAVYVSSPGGRDAVGLKKTGIALTHFNIGAMKVSTVPLPPLPEQQQIIGEVDRRLSVADEVETQIDTNLKRAGRLRQAVLKRAFEGRLINGE